MAWSQSGAALVRAPGIKRARALSRVWRREFWSFGRCRGKKTKKTTEIRSVRGRFAPRPRHPARRRRNSDSPRSAPLLSPQLSGRKVLMAAATARSLSICCGVTPFFQSHLAPADSDGKSAVLFQFLLPKMAPDRWQVLLSGADER